VKQTLTNWTHVAAPAWVEALFDGQLSTVRCVSFETGQRNLTFSELGFTRV